MDIVESWFNVLYIQVCLVGTPRNIVLETSMQDSVRTSTLTFNIVKVGFREIGSFTDQGT